MPLRLAAEIARMMDSQGDCWAVQWDAGALPIFDPVFSRVAMLLEHYVQIVEFP
jgi:hypothetical protein